MRFNLDDNRLWCRPNLGLIIDQPEQPLWLTGSLVLFESLVQQVLLIARSREFMPIPNV
jgi:hypothetical protein